MPQQPDALRWFVPTEWLTDKAFVAQNQENQGALHAVPLRSWKPLFDGQTLNGWVVQDKAELWNVEDQAIKCLGRGGGYLRSADPYEDFALAGEFKVDKGTNSGIFLRWSNLRDPVNTGIEVQVFDSAHKAKPGKHDAGALYDLVAPTQNAMRPPDEWNRIVVFCKGPYIGVRLNGAKVSEMDTSRYTQPGRNPDGSRNKFRYALASLPRRGYIGLQNHGGVVWYRNLRVLSL